MSPTTEARAQVRQSSVAGRGLFATTTIAAGTTAIELDRPLITAVESKLLHAVCSHCLRITDLTSVGSFDALSPSRTETTILQKCSGCKTLFYCSRDCYIKDWSLCHKNECKILARTATRGVLPTAARAVLRMLSVVSNDDNCDLTKIVSHLETIKERRGERLESLTWLSIGVHQYSKTKQSIQLVQDYFAKVFTNTLTVTSPTFDPLGICLDPLISAVNHSCDPNAVVVFNGAKLSLRTLRPIQIDEELFISYIDSSNPYEIRQEELSELFYFSCECSRCHTECSSEDVLAVNTTESFCHNIQKQDIQISTDQSPKIREIYNLASRRLKSAQATKNSVEALAEISAGIKICTDSRNWPHYRQPLPALRHQAFLFFLQTNNFSAAFKSGLMYHFKALPVHYPQQFHPLRVVSAWAMAKLAFYLCNPNEPRENREYREAGLNLHYVACRFMSDLMKQLEKSHGKDSALLALIKSDMTDLGIDLESCIIDPVSPDNQWILLQQIIE